MPETTGTLSNTSVAIAARAGRRWIIFGNPSDTVMTARYAESGDASTTVGVPIPAGQAVILQGGEWAGRWSLFCAGTSKAYYILEG